MQNLKLNPDAIRDKTFYFFIVLLTFSFLLLTFTHPVFAHFLASDKNIGAVLHVDPNDEPIANSQASFFFEFKDKENKFDPKQCACLFLILENGKEIFSQPLFQNSQNPTLTSASVFYTFPKRDVYQVKVVGKPQGSSFQPFTLTWDFRVDQTATGQTNQTSSSFFVAHIVHAIILGLFGIFFIGYFMRRIWFKKNPASAKTSAGQKGGEKYDKEDSGTLY